MCPQIASDLGEALSACVFFLNGKRFIDFLVGENTATTSSERLISRGLRVRSTSANKSARGGASRLMSAADVNG